MSDGLGLSLCVFCGSASGLPEVHRQAARDLGREIARRGHRLVFGGSDVGLMRELARSVHRHGGRVFGAIPRALVERDLAYGPTDELVVTENLRDPNAGMVSHPPVGFSWFRRRPPGTTVAAGGRAHAGVRS